MEKDNIKTLVINKWDGRLTRYRDGDINSGYAYYFGTHGADTLDNPGNLTFYQDPVNITGGVITDLIMAGKPRVESAVTYMYCIGHTGRLYKIQVNNPATKNPFYNTPVLLATLTGGQTFKFGASLEFFRASTTERIWIGHDTGITRINFDGTSETNLAGGSWTTNVPRQTVEFAGKLYVANGSNLAAIDSSETVSTYTALSPGFPANMQVRDLDTTPDGRYIVSTMSRNPIGDMTLATQSTNDITGSPSMLIYWNGTDLAASTSNSFPSFGLSSYKAFGKNEYVFGLQIGGAQFGTPDKVIELDAFGQAPLPNAVGSSGDFVGWASPFWDLGVLKASLNLYGQVDSSMQVGFYRQCLMASTLAGGDVIRVPFYAGATSWYQGGITSGYTNTYEIIGTALTYFSTIESDGTNTKYGFYAFSNAQDLLNVAGTGSYETQHQLFSKKIKVTEVRCYIEPATASTSFTIDLMGIDDVAITGGSKTFSSITGQDLVQYNPNPTATSALGVKITNVGSVAPFIHKVEIDYTPYGK